MPPMDCIKLSVVLSHLSGLTNCVLLRVKRIIVKDSFQLSRLLQSVNLFLKQAQVWAVLFER